MPHATPKCILHVAYGDPSAGGLPVSIGVPFPAGTLKDPATLSVTGPDGEARPAAGRVLARHRDGSIRWGLVSFGARAAGPHRVDWTEPPTVAPDPAVTVTQAEEAWTLDNGRLRVTLCKTGPGIFGEIVCDDHAWLSDPSHLHFSADDASTRHETRRTPRILEATPLRARVRVEGAHFTAGGARKLNYRLDVELWAGQSTLRLDYHYFNLEKGRPFQRVRRIAMDADWALGSETQRHFLQKNYGLYYVTRHVFNPDPVAIAADVRRPAPHVEDPAMLLDDVDYPFYLKAPLVTTHDWLGAGDGEHSVYLRMADFSAAVPNRMTSENGSLSAEFWPSTAETLELPQGRSRRQTLTLAFLAGETIESGSAKVSNAPVQAPKGVAARLQAPLHEGRAALSPEWIAHCGEFKQAHTLPFERHARIEDNLSDLVRLDMPRTKFDVGDTDSHYNTGRSGVFLPGAPEISPIFPRSNPTQTYLDLTEPVWTNNEYDAIHAFCKELMRTGRSELWNTLRLAARHNIEVDFLHYSDHRWHHRATPAHSVHHTTTGAYPSHFWTQGLLEYYCLSGDPDALEVAVALGDKTIEFFHDPDQRKVLWGFNREIGWSVLLLACLVDITGEARFRKLLDEMVEYLIGFDRETYQGGINLSGGNDRLSMNRQIVDCFFGYASMMEGIDLYLDLTDRKDVADWLDKFCHDLADEAVNAAREGKMRGIDFGTALGIGYERTGDKRFLQLTGLVLDRAYWNAPGVQGGGSAKPVAYAYRGLIRVLGPAWRHGLLDRYEYPSMRELKKSQ